MYRLTLGNQWLHPEGTFNARLAGLECREGELTPGIHWLFETGIQRPGGTLARIGLRTGTLIKEGNSLAELLKAFGVALPKTEAEAAAILIEEFLGRECQVVAKQDEDFDGHRIVFIEHVFPLNT